MNSICSSEDDGKTCCYISVAGLAKADHSTVIGMDDDLKQKLDDRFSYPRRKNLTNSNVYVGAPPQEVSNFLTTLGYQTIGNKDMNSWIVRFLRKEFK